MPFGIFIVNHQKILALPVVEQVKVGGRRRLIPVIQGRIAPQLLSHAAACEQWQQQEPHAPQHSSHLRVHADFWNLKSNIRSITTIVQQFPQTGMGPRTGTSGMYAIPILRLKSKLIIAE